MSAHPVVWLILFVTERGHLARWTLADHDGTSTLSKR
jgi:hypothetical protein